jgi:hypothetical protein
MYNKEIYEKLLLEFTESKMTTVTDIISTFYDIKFNAAENEEMSNMYDYNRQWWMNKHIEIIKKTEKC